MVLERKEGDPRDVASPDFAVYPKVLGLCAGVSDAYSVALSLPTLLGAGLGRAHLLVHEVCCCACPVKLWPTS